MNQYILFTLLGAFLMFIILKIISQGKSINTSDTTELFIEVAKTGQAMNVVKTNEFRELAKTTEFKSLVRSLTEDQIKKVSQTLIVR